MNTPTWAAAAVAAVTVLTALGAFVAWTQGVFTRRGTAEEEAQKRRDDKATHEADRTIESVFRLLDELQEERVELKAQIVVLTGRVGKLEAELDRLKGPMSLPL